MPKTGFWTLEWIDVFELERNDEGSETSQWDKNWMAKWNHAGFHQPLLNPIDWVEIVGLWPFNKVDILELGRRNDEQIGRSD